MTYSVALALSHESRHRSRASQSRSQPVHQSRHGARYTSPTPRRSPSAVGKWLADGAIARLLIAQRDLVRLGDLVGLDRSESLAEALAGLAEELERVSGWTPGSCPLRLCP